MPKVYTVGGYVRDTLLHETHPDIVPGDRDWVVVGSTPEAMLERGFQPVGADFPVFLHPVTHEEYALARTERKTAPGYKGFVFHAASDVTLEEDLRRRDLTINAIAMDEDGHLFDPFGGQKDLREGILRHVSPAFSEDPVRVLRIARFQARFPDFSIAPETLLLLRRMVDDGETRALVPERIGMEFKKGLMTKAPEKMFETLKTIGFWEDFAPDLPCTDETLALLRKTARENLAYPERFAALTLEARDEDTIARFMKSVRADRESADLAQAFLCARQLLTTALETEALCRFYRRADAARKEFGPRRISGRSLRTEKKNGFCGDSPPGTAWMRAPSPAAAPISEASLKPFSPPAGRRWNNVSRETRQKSLMRRSPTTASSIVLMRGSSTLRPKASK